MKKFWLILLIMAVTTLVACQTEPEATGQPDPAAEEGSPSIQDPGGGEAAKPTSQVPDETAPTAAVELADEEAASSLDQEEGGWLDPGGANISFDPYGGIAASDFETSESGLQYYFYEEGNGQVAGKGQMVVLNMVGWTEIGTEVANTIAFGGPVPFPVDATTGIVGLDEALSIMSDGSAARIVIPAELVVNEAGEASPLPPGVLVFELSDVEIVDGPPESPQDVADDAYTLTDSGLKYYDLVPGEGEEVVSGNAVSVNYTGWLDDDTVFDSSVGQSPFGFIVDAGQVIAGWDEGLKGMKVGGTRQLVIPPELGYGSNGSGDIPPGSVLIFEVELLEIKEGPPEAPQEVDDASYTVTESGLKYFDLEEGQGKAIEAGDQATVNYTGWLEDGTLFDSSIGRRPFTLVVGQGQVITGWDEGLMGLKPGGRRQLVIPPELAYGPAGSGPIPPDAVLIFEVEIIDVQ